MTVLDRVSKIALAAIGVGLLASCSNDMDPNYGTRGAKLLRATELRAWSGNQSFGLGTRAVVDEFYQVMPDYTDWCNSWWPKDVAQYANIPDDAIDASKYPFTNFEEGKSYVLSGTLNGFGTGLDAYEGIDLTSIPDNVTIYVKDGAWALFDDFTGKNLNIIVCQDAEVVLKDYEGDREIVYGNINIFNYGSAYVYYNNNSAIGEGCNIYNTGKMVIEQNYIDDNDDLSLDPFTITTPIYSGGSESEVYFKGGVIIDTDKAYFRKVCVDGQMTVESGKTVHTGYLNADELYGHDNSTVDMAPEGMIVAGTISMKKSAKVAGSKTSNGFVLTNEIIGIRKTQGTEGSKMESEVDKDNFSTIFKNVDIYVTRTINNTQDLAELKEYKAENGVTYPLDAETEFDASENDEVRNGDVNKWDCGIGYRYVRKNVPEETCDKCDHPKHPGTNCPECEEGVECNPGAGEVEPTPDPTPDPNPGVVAPDVRHDNEVEVNLSLNDSHSAYTDEDLVSKLSIHVRYPGDVEVFIPVPKGYLCEADDFNIREADLYIPGSDSEVSYEIGGKTVTLKVVHEDDGIRVTTSGIDQDVIDFCMENYGDGVNFEIFNYYGLYELDAEGNYVRAENGNIARETLLEYLNRATVEFLDNPNPDYYINAFEANREGEGDHDCTVSIIDRQQSSYGNDYEGAHLNNSEWNHIYVRNGVTPDHAHSK